MALDSIPRLGGEFLRRPASRTASLEPIESQVVLASGAVRRYSRGSRRVWSLTWRNLPEVEAQTVDRLCRRRDPLPFIDQDGVAYTVLVGDYSGLEAVPGTAPTRYGASVKLETQGTVL